MYAHYCESFNQTSLGVLNGGNVLKEKDQIEISLQCNETLLFGELANHSGRVAAQIAQSKKKRVQ